MVDEDAIAIQKLLAIDDLAAVSLDLRLVLFLTHCVFGTEA
jgi:hypothetical protein